MLINRQDDKAQGSNADEEEGEDLLVSFDDCKSLHYIQTKLRTAKRALGCCSDLTDRLGDDWSSLGIWMRGLKDYKQDIASLQENLDLMIERSSRISSLVSMVPHFTLSEPNTDL